MPPTRCLQFSTRIPGPQTAAEPTPVLSGQPEVLDFLRKFKMCLSFKEICEICKELLQDLKTYTFFRMYKCSEMIVPLYLWPEFWCTDLGPTCQGVLAYSLHASLGLTRDAQGLSTYHQMREWRWVDKTHLS